MTTYKENMNLLGKLINKLHKENNNYAYIVGYLESLMASNMTTNMRKAIEYKINRN